MEKKKVVCHDIQGRKYKVAVSDLTFRPSIYGIIIQKGKILLSRQWEGYDFPGGGIELGETHEKALIREVKEETGFEVSVGKLVFCTDSFFKMPFTGTFVHSILIYYLCRIKSGKISTEFFDDLEKEYVKEPEWVDLNKVNQIKFYTSADGIKIISEAKKILR